MATQPLVPGVAQSPRVRLKGAWVVPAVTKAYQTSASRLD